MTVTSIGKNSPVAPIVTPPPVTPARPSTHKTSTLYVAPAPIKSNADVSFAPSASYTKAEASGNRKPTAQEMILSRMAERIITKQYSEGNQFYKLLYGHIALRIDPNLRSKDMAPSREELMKRAREMVGENAPFSSETIASQIVRVVGDLSEGDPAKTERFRAAVHDAFAKLATMSGGRMPELTQKTYDAVMEGLDAPSAPAVAPAAKPVSAEPVHTPAPTPAPPPVAPVHTPAPTSAAKPVSAEPLGTASGQ